MKNEPQTSKMPQGAASASTPVQKQDNAAPAASQQEKTAMLSVEIKKAWNKLSDEDVKLEGSNPDQFYAKIKEKHNVGREDAQKRLKEIKASCDSSCAEKAA